jgi:hypothetical protein
VEQSNQVGPTRGELTRSESQRRVDEKASGHPRATREDPRIPRRRVTTRTHTVIALTLLGGLLALEGAQPTADGGRTPLVWRVAPSGDDSRGDGSTDRPFRSIQKGLDHANDGDTVEVREGTYSGPGNRDLDFRGRSVTLRSCAPNSDTCLKQTIIDAGGEGVIFRFVNDEGSGTEVLGFTLRPGDPLQPVARGVPGFFEFSAGARPTTGRLRLDSETNHAPGQAPVSTGAIQAIPLATTGYPTGDRGVYWNGRDPFHQPVNTTDYYGSGDIDLDGAITTQDVWLASQIGAGSLKAVVQADANGDGSYDDLDTALIQSAVSGASLPAWWNSATSRDQRDSWIDKVLAADPTDQHPYQPWWQCGNFCTQLFLRFATYGFDIIGGPYSHGQTVFNLPVYAVTVASASYGHCINAVLVGDNPLAFGEWRFIEPQTDAEVTPGQWDMPFGTRVRLELPQRIQEGGHSYDFSPATFEVLESGVTTVASDPDLVLQRNSLEPEAPDSRANVWNPVIAPGGPPLLLYERTRADPSRVSDIHVTDLFSTDFSGRRPLVHDPYFTALLDVRRDAGQRIHVLWRGKPDGALGVFHAYLNPDDRRLTDDTRVFEESQNHVAFSGQVVVDSAGQVHVFWLESGGIHWSRQSEEGWMPPVLVLSPPLWYPLHSLQRDRRRARFAVAATPEGEVVLVSVGEDPATLLELRYHDGTWGAPETIEEAQGSSEIGGVDLAAAPGGLLHLAYWRASPRYVLDPEWGLGPMHARTRTAAGGWSSPQTVDAGSAGFPHLSVAADGAAYMIWLRFNTAEGRAAPVWKTWKDGTWGSERLIPVSEGADVWYPVIECLDSGAVEAAWCERSSRGVTIGRQSISRQRSRDRGRYSAPRQ